jgi:hypothetical protein
MRLNLGIVAHAEGVTIELEPTLEQEIRKGQIGDAKIQEIKDLITEGRVPEFTEDEQGTIWIKDQICVPEIESLRETILNEAHDSDYSIVPIKDTRMVVGKIGMDFIIGLPHIPKGYDSIWVVEDRWTKVAHFIPVKTTYNGSQLAELYMARIVSLHGVPKKIVSNRGS